MRRIFALLASLVLLLLTFGTVVSVASATPQPEAHGTTVAVTPCRIADSRQWQTLTTFSAFTTQTLRVTDICGIPANHVTGVFLSLTVVPLDNYYPGFLTVWPNGATRPEVSQLSFTWQTQSSSALVGGLGHDGIVQIFNGSPSWADVIVDVEGYVTD